MAENRDLEVKRDYDRIGVTKTPSLFGEAECRAYIVDMFR
jgi:hypothetical protein